MLVTWVKLRDFRTYERAHVELSPCLTVVHGPNGAGKTNLLEALYFGCLGRSVRTTNEREVVRFGARAARVQIGTANEDGEHELSVGFGVLDGESRLTKRMQVDGVSVERLSDIQVRPLIGVFLPDRLELIKGSPSLRRAHMDQLVAALWPSRRAARVNYSRVLLQRNALLAGIRTGRSSGDTLPVWDRELALTALELASHRAEAVDLLSDPFCRRASELGLSGDVHLGYRPRSSAFTPEEFLAELHQRRASDIERGFSTYGPHRDELTFTRDERDLRTYGSQGEQRLVVLSLLLAERDVLGSVRGEVPLMLLDDVMSELDASRRSFLIEVLSDAGQSVITTTEPGHVPHVSGCVRLDITPNQILGAVGAGASLDGATGP